MQRTTNGGGRLPVVGLAAAVLVVLATACADNGSRPPPDPGTVDAGQQGTDAGSGGGGSSPEDAGAPDAGNGCTADEVGCSDDFTAFECDSTGTVRTETPCATGTYCNGGTCLAQSCVPGAQFCIDVRVRGVCDARGSFLEAFPCAPGEGCQDGVCVPCTCSPDITRRCGTAELWSRERCNLDCRTYRADNCAADQTCTGNGACTPHVCTPSAPTCDGTTGTRLCDADGLGYGPTTPCGTASSCDAATGLCAAWTCTPNAATCNANSRSVCNADGLGETVTACAAGESCRDAGICAVRCGDGIRNATEPCDDGNTVSGDGCTATCEVEWPASCLAVRDAVVAPAVPTNGVYRIDPDGTGGEPPFDVYCDMTSDGGGWTLVVAQFEAAPETSWNRGKLNTYDPTLILGRSFTLNSQQIPTHTQTAFGRGTVATYVDYVDLVYTTGNLVVAPPQALQGKRTGNSFHVHREATSWWYDNDPEYPNWVRADGNCSYGWCNSLTFDQTGGAMHSWAFSPNYGTRSFRGFALSGNLKNSSESFAWTVWVR